jgi:hypothetical protein
MIRFYFHIERQGSASKTIYVILAQTDHEARSLLVSLIGSHNYTVGLVGSWKE